MAALDRAQPAPAAPQAAWRTRDILVTALIGVVFGVVFSAWNLVWSVVAPATAVAPLHAFLLYGVWLVPAVLAPLIVRKPGAAVFAEMVAAGVSAFLGNPWGPDVLLSGFVQGAAAELVFAMTLYRLVAAGARPGRGRVSRRGMDSRLGAVLPGCGRAPAGCARGRDGRLGDRDRGGRVGRARALAAQGGRPGGVRRLSGGAEAAPPRSIRAAGAAFTYAGSPRPAFRDLELEVEPGAVLLVVGPSGSGKSTLARGIAGLLPEQFPGAWQGSLKVGDAEVARNDGDEESGEAATPLSTASLGAGIVLQDPATQLVMERVGDDVAFGLENAAWPLRQMRARVPEALESVGLRGFEERRSTRLSGGEQQRVALAGVLAPRPGLLVLDEPTAHLDPEGTAAILDALRAIRAGGKTTMVLIEHRAEQGWPLADVVLALDDEGRPIDVGPPSAVLKRSRRRLSGAGIWLPEDAAAASVPGPPAASGALTSGTVPVLEMTGLRFSYDRENTVLRDVELTVRPGERVAMVGANGSGKTTLLRLALGLRRPTAGVARLGGRDPSRIPPVQLARLAGYVVQEPELGFLADSVREEVELGLEPEQIGYAHALCDHLRLPLEAFGDRSPYRLSGGEQRRLSLVTGLARRPLLLALDEPTFGQDRRGHEALVSALAELVEDGSALLAATHDERFVREATDRRVELAAGWIVEDAAVKAARAAAVTSPEPDVAARR